MHFYTIKKFQFYPGKVLCFLVSLLLLSFVANAQLRKVKGVVKNAETGAPVSNATVQVKGTKTAVSTNGNGEFTLSVSGNETLEISSVGYNRSEVKVNSRNDYNISLSQNAKSEETVVVTALGIKRQEKALGYSTTTLKGDDFTNAISNNWTDALSGKVAGLNLIRSNGGPTASNSIILRGEANLTSSNEALIVVDGVVINNGSGKRTAISGENTYGTGSDNQPVDYGSSINDINPDDIESVTVLKGPGAAALYGERAANGAVIITTKTGRAKKRGLGITFNSNASIEQINRWPDLQYKYGQGVDGNDYYSFGASVDGNSTSATSSAYGPRFNGQKFFQLNPATQMQGTERTPWVGYPNKSREYFEKGHTLTNSISLDGGTDKTSARFSYTNVYNDWIIPNTGYKRNTVALSVNSAITDKLQISSKINYTNKASDNLPGSGYGNQSIMYWYIFWQPNADVDWLKNYWVQGQEGKKIFYPYSTFPENPYAIAYEFINATNRNGVTGNIQASYNFTKSLSLQVRTSLDFAYDQRSQKRPYDAGSRYQKGSYRTQHIYSQELNTDFLLKYAYKLNSNFDFSATGGGSQLRNRYIKDEVRADSLTYPGLYSFSNNAGPLVSLPYNSSYAINSLYGLITTGYKNFLYVDFTGRKDWNSVLAAPDRTANSGFFYSSANASFIASEVIKFPKFVNFAKLRFSTSGVGSGQTTPYLTAFNYATAGSIYSGGLQNPSVLANPDLKPQFTTSNELGAVVRLWKNRLNIDVAIYKSSTRDQILQRIIDRSAGYTTTVINAGKVNNKGFELSLDVTPVKTISGFKWTSGLVFSSNKGRVAELADSAVVLGTGPVGGGQIVAKVGGTLGDLYGRGYLRSPDGQVVYDAKTGFAKLTDEVIYLGTTIPKGKLGLSNDFSYKGFKLHVLFDGQWGAVGHSLTHYKLAEQGKLTKTLPGRYNGIIGNGVVMDANGKYVSNTTIATDIDQYYRSHFGIDNAEGSTFSTDFIKFREARVDYSFGPKITKRLGMQRLTLGVYGRDLFIWTKWPSFDPEFGTLSGTDIVRGFEIGQFPSTRSIGVNLLVGL